MTGGTTATPEAVEASTRSGGFMKLREILRFELGYQLRRPWPWLAFGVMVVFCFENARSALIPATLPQEFILNSPFTIAAVTVFSSMIWLLVASAMAGDAAARDVQTGLHRLTYTTPITRFEYLGGRFTAAFLLNAFVLLGAQIGILLGFYAGGVDQAMMGPFRPLAHLAAFAFIALPNAFIATSVQFSFALASGRSIAGYAGSVVLMFFTIPVPILLYFALGRPDLALLADPIGMFAIMNSMMLEWTIVEKNVRMFTLEGHMLWNRLLWLGIACTTLAITYARFRFAHRVAFDPWQWLSRRLPARAPRPIDSAHAPAAISVPAVRQSFGLATQLRQTLSIARSSARMIATSPAGLFLLFAFPLFVVVVLVAQSEQWGIPLIPRTGYIVAKHLTSSISYVSDFRAMVPLLIIYFASELVWRERDARLAENIDATPVPEWVLLAGKLLGLGVVLAAFMLSLTASGVLAQTIMGHHDYRLDLYFTMLFGLQLPEYLLFGVLSVGIQSVTTDRYVGIFLTVVAWAFIIFAGWIGIDHNLLVYSKGPDWDYTDVRGFAASLNPWLWFKLYWAMWAVLLAVAARLLWVRGRESDFAARMRLVRSRLTRNTAAVTAVAGLLVLVLGGFIFYNTNILNEFIPADELERRRASYEKLYGQYEGVPQPQRTDTRVRVEIHPDRGLATFQGTYRLVNRDSTPIPAIHIEPSFYADTRVSFDRPYREVVADAKLGHSIYELEEPLQPGDSVTMSFDVRIERRGFGNGGALDQVIGNGSHIASYALPVIGYQPLRELWSPEDRRKHGLPHQVTIASPTDLDPNLTSADPWTFDAVIGTDADQIAIAPGELRRTWTENGRRYFHYATDVPITGTEMFFSAEYAVHRERWKHVDIQVYLHPGHREHLERLLRSVRASLEYYSEQFGEYPFPFLQIIEQPGNFLGMGVDGSGVITGGEGFFLLDPPGDGFDAIFEVVAHEMGHQWWAIQLRPAVAEGGGVISEGLAWYSAIQLVKNVQGPAALRRFMGLMREPSPWPPIRTGLPLLRAIDPWSNYRKTPYAMYALSEYLGEDRVNGALRTLIERKATSLATSLDLYRELQAVTPDSFQYLLHDLFETSTFWELNAVNPTATRTPAGEWELTMQVHARKVVADSAGKKTELGMDEWVPIGVFGKPRDGGGELGNRIYHRMHRIRSGVQTITVLVPERPVLAGVDPDHLLDWVEDGNDDNIEQVVIPTEESPPR